MTRPSTYCLQMFRALDEGHTGICKPTIFLLDVYGKLSINTVLILSVLGIGIRAIVWHGRVLRESQWAIDSNLG